MSRTKKKGGSYPPVQGMPIHLNLDGLQCDPKWEDHYVLLADIPLTCEEFDAWVSWVLSSTESVTVKSMADRLGISLSVFNEYRNPEKEFFPAWLVKRIVAYRRVLLGLSVAKL